MLARASLSLILVTAACGAGVRYQPDYTGSDDYVFRARPIISLGKAGRSRWMGIRPTVRGTAMNPIDHPHGGGEGRTKGGRHPVTPWGQPTKGYKTRHNKSTDKMIVRRRNAK